MRAPYINFIFLVNCARADRETKLNYLNLITKYNSKIGEFKKLCFEESKCSWEHDVFLCQYDIIKNNCPAYISDDYLNRKIKLLADHLYKLRSQFIHEAKLPLFADYDVRSLPKEFQYESGDIALKRSIVYIIKDKGKNINYMSELEIKGFYDLIMHNIVKTMKKYLDEVN